MDFQFLFKGLFIGLAIAAPVGPIGVLCIRRSLAEGGMMGFVTGLGAAAADAVYGAIAAFGLGAVSAFLISSKDFLGIVGGIFLCYLGIRTFIQKPATQERAPGQANLFSALLGTFFLTLTNPMTILSFVAIFAGIGLPEASGRMAAFTLVIGVFLGSAAWWLFLSSISARFGSRMNLQKMKWVNRLSGCLIFGFGIWSLLQSALEKR